MSNDMSMGEYEEMFWGPYEDDSSVTIKPVKKPVKKKTGEEDPLDPIWVTKDWRVIVIKNLESEYLVNIIRYCRRHDVYVNRFGQYVWPYLLAEASKRGLPTQ